jgi:hypothetical protein
MSSIKLESNASGTGIFTIASPNSNTNRTLTIPDATGTLVTTDATQTLTNKTFTNPIISGTVITAATSQATTSGTSIDFTGIPSYVKRITVIFNGVSGNGTSNLLIQLGTGSTTYTTSGYNSSTLAGAASGNAFGSSTAGFILWQDTASFTMSGNMILTNISSNNWVSSGVVKLSTAVNAYTGGDVSLGALLTAVRITRVNGTDTFDAGSINIFYE